jgi:hypothetical protein
VFHHRIPKYTRSELRYFPRDDQHESRLDACDLHEVATIRAAALTSGAMIIGNSPSTRYQLRRSDTCNLATLGPRLPAQYRCGGTRGK